MPSRLTEAIGAVVGAYAGLEPPAWLLEARTRERARELGLDEAGYLALVGGEGAAAARERALLADRLRVGETRFFRHAAHVTALRGRVLPERARAAAAEGRPIRAWSAGCATGEEAWTLAMLLEEAAPGRWELAASDLSAAALEAARAGRYPLARLDDVPAPLRARWFPVERDGAATVRPELAARVRFFQHNLLDAAYPRALDVVFCRNVLIYFESARRAEVISRLGRAIVPGGWLFLGYSEALRDGGPFEATRDDDGLVYRRRERDEKSGLLRLDDQTGPVRLDDPTGPVRLGDSAPIALAARPARDDEKTGPVAPRPVARLRGDYHDADRLAAELRPLVGLEGARVELDGASYLGDEAARVLVRAVQAAPSLRLHATRASVRRWLSRHGLRGVE